jgi:hypothetical protein
MNKLGLFIFIDVLAQLRCAVLLPRRASSRTVLVAGRWKCSHLPLDRHPHGRHPARSAGREVEAIGVVDTVSKLAEAALIGCLFRLLHNSVQEC